MLYGGVFLYHWDTRDGPDFSGWWFGNRVGGDHVWSHPSSAQSPPHTGWRIPWFGEAPPGLLIVDMNEEDWDSEGSTERIGVFLQNRLGD